MYSVYQMELAFPNPFSVMEPMTAGTGLMKYIFVVSQVCSLSLNVK